MPDQRIINISQFTQLQKDIISDDRVAFYHHLFIYTGSENALMMAKISSGSEIIGGIAWAVNREIQKVYPDKYPPGGVASFSKTIATNDLGLITANPDGSGNFLVPSELQMLQGAYSMWEIRGLGEKFPGLPMYSIALTMNGDYASAAKFATQSKNFLSTLVPAMKEAAGELYDSRTNYAKSIQECLDQNPYATIRHLITWGQDVTQVVAKDGKTVCVFSKIEQTPIFDLINEELRFQIKGIYDKFNLSQSANGDSIVTWSDLDGAKGIDVYHTTGSFRYLDKSDITINTASGGTSRGIYDVNPDGHVQNQQVLQTNAAGQVNG